MLNQLLDNPAYMRLLKNATSLNASEIATVPADVIPIIPPTIPMIISAAKPVNPPPITATAIISTDPPKNKGGVNLFAIIGFGIIVGIVGYNLYIYYSEKNKSNKI